MDKCRNDPLGRRSDTCRRAIAAYDGNHGDGDESRLINEREILLLAMRTEATDGNKIEAVQNEIIEIVSAWNRGELLPRSDAPLLSQIYERGFTP